MNSFGLSLCIVSDHKWVFFNFFCKKMKKNAFMIEKIVNRIIENPFCGVFKWFSRFFKGIIENPASFGPKTHFRWVFWPIFAHFLQKWAKKAKEAGFSRFLLKNRQKCRFFAKTGSFWPKSGQNGPKTPQNPIFR